MADVFELKGKIVIDNSDANDDLDETIKKAKDVGDAIEEAGSNAGTAGQGFTAPAAAQPMHTMQPAA